MKSIFTFISLLILCYLSSGTLKAAVAVGPVAQPSAGEVVDLQALGMTGMGEMTLEEFLGMKPRDVRARTGKKMRLKERIAFGLVKHSLKKQLRKAKKPGEATIDLLGGFEFSLLGFLLGLILGILGFIIALFLGEDVWKSSLLGLAAWLVIVLIFFIL